MTTTPARYPLAADFFDGRSMLDRSNGRASLVDILNSLLGGGFIGTMLSADLPETSAEWVALGFTAVPDSGPWAFVSDESAPNYWDGTTWRTAGGALAPSGQAILLSIGPVAAKSTTSVHALYDNSSAAFPGPFTNPDVPRNLRVTFSALWDGGDVTVTGTDQFDDVISEVFADAAGTTVVGLKIFKTVTGATKELPAGVAGNGASIGTGDLIGVPGELTDEVGFLWVGTVAEAVTLDDTLNTFAPTTTPAATTYKLLANLISG